MFIKDEISILTMRKKCAICGGRKLEPVINLPNLPLSGIYSTEPMKGALTGIDQQLLVCMDCSHAQLTSQVDPDVLYANNYSFRTSVSATAQKGTKFFLSALDSIASSRQFKCILDVGCNDLYLLKKLKNRAKVRIGIDPLWDSKEDERDDKDITLIGSAIENVDLKSILETPPDLIVCRHTLEHIFEPQAVLEKLFSVAANNALFLFEIPNFDSLLERLRFDQIFHQHLQYFTLLSFRRLLKEIGGVFISHRENYHDWGTLLIAFTKDGKQDNKSDTNFLPLFSISEIHKRYSIFQRQMSVTNNVLKAFEGTKVYGYGAARMLPIMAYHLKNDFSLLEAVLDDDSSKDGLHYSNLPLVIRDMAKIRGIESTSVFITAVDNVKPILNKLIIKRPRNIIYPFHIV